MWGNMFSADFPLIYLSPAMHVSNLRKLGRNFCNGYILIGSRGPSLMSYCVKDDHLSQRRYQDMLGNGCTLVYVGCTLFCLFISFNGEAAHSSVVIGVLCLIYVICLRVCLGYMAS